MLVWILAIILLVALSILVLAFAAPQAFRKVAKRYWAWIAHSCLVRRYWIGRINTALDQNIVWSGLFWTVGTAGNGAVLLALDSKYTGLLPLDMSKLLEIRWLLWTCLLAAPTLGAGKKLLRKLEVKDEAARLDLSNKVALCHQQCCQSLAAHLEHCVAASLQPRAQVLLSEMIGIVIGHLAVEFSYIAGEDPNLVKVIAARVENNRLVDVTLRAPTGVANISPVLQLSREGTTFWHCIRRRGPVLIPNIEVDAGRHFLTTEANPDGAKGSLLCYPVIRHNNKIRYVLSVYCKKTDRFFFAERHFYWRELATYSAYIVHACAMVERMEVSREIEGSE